MAVIRKAVGGASEMSAMIVDKVSTLIISAFGLVAALAWNSAIQKVISGFITTSDQTLGLMIYALIVTAIAVVVTVYLTHVVGKIGKKKQ